MKFLNIDRIYLAEMARLINRKDIRPVKTWCKKNNVNIFKDTTGEFVYRIEFEFANDLPLIQFLRSKYGKDWEMYYGIYLKGELYKILEFAQDRHKQTGYKAKGELSKKLFGGSPK